ncbi:hypothetical protein MMC11_003652 [Xylographa trunciseda]|nr:hypothetical protein [Xylographa trunciseda]
MNDVGQHQEFHDNFILNVFKNCWPNRSTLKKSLPLPEEDGFHIVYEGHEPMVDIVAIHGLHGGWSKSWTDPVTATFWLQDLLPEIVPNTRILSFGYDASNTSTTHLALIARALVPKLVDLRETTKSAGRPIVWMAHSLGGQLLKGALAFSHQSGRNHVYGHIKLCTYGILFFGVPKPRKEGCSISTAMKTQEVAAKSDSPQMKALKRELIWLRKTDELYSTIYKDFVTKYLTESSNEVAEESKCSTSLADKLDYTELESIPLSKTHGRMVQFPDANDKDYQVVSACLVMMVAGATEKG